MPSKLNLVLLFALASCGPRPDTLIPAPGIDGSGTNARDAGDAESSTPSVDASTDRFRGAPHLDGGPCPMQFAYVRDDGVVLVDSTSKEHFVSAPQALSQLGALPGSCGEGLTIYWSVPSDKEKAARRQERVTAFYETLRREHGRTFTLTYDGEKTGGVAEGNVRPGQSLGELAQVVRVPVQVQEAGSSCLDSALGLTPQDVTRLTEQRRIVDQRWDTGPAFSGVDVRVTYRGGQMVIWVPSASEPPTNPSGSNRCRTFWKTSPLTVRVPWTRLPMVWSLDAEKHIAPLAVRSDVAVR